MLLQAPREMKSVALACGVPLKSLHHATDVFKEVLRGAVYYERLFTTVRAGNLINSYGDRLTASSGEVRKAVKRGAHRLDEALSGLLDTGRKPATVCAGLLWHGARIERVSLSKKALVDACGVCQQTLDRIASELSEIMLENDIAL